MKPKPRRCAVVLLGGGWQGAVLLAEAKSTCEVVYGVTLDYGQPPRAKVQYLHSLWGYFGIPSERYKYVTVDVDLGKTGIAGFWYIQTGVAVALSERCNEVWYVSLPESQMRAAGKVLQLLNTPGVRLHNPFGNMGEEELARHGDALHVPYRLTMDCESPAALTFSCGACRKCRQRRRLFKRLFGDDMTNLR